MTRLLHVDFPTTDSAAISEMHLRKPECHLSISLKFSICNPFGFKTLFTILTSEVEIFSFLVQLHHGLLLSLEFIFPHLSVIFSLLVPPPFDHEGHTDTSLDLRFDTCLDRCIHQ